MNSDISQFLIRAESSIRDAIACIDSNKAKIAIVIDEECRLLDTITDGDIRRAVLEGFDLSKPVNVLRNRRKGSVYPEPIAAPVETECSELLRLMNENDVRQVPLLDKMGRVVGLVTLDELQDRESLPLQAVVLAGGFGTRLRPLTNDIPKTMLAVGGKPLLESIVKGLQEAGIKRVNLATHYKSEMISEHFGDGRDFGVEIRYVNEDNPLGTAGALRLLSDSEEPLLIINGDILTQVDFRAMLDFHMDHHADMTVAVREHEYQVPYGVIEGEGLAVTGISEKPVQRHLINAGIYLVNPGVCLLIPDGRACDMPELIRKLLEEHRRVISFPVREYWLDIGRFDDYERAQREYQDVFEKPEIS